MHSRPIEKLILEVVQELNSTFEHPVDLQAGGAAFLYGRKGSLDSISLVALVVAVEQAIQDEYDITVALADERAMSQASSPFRTVSSLAAYAQLRMDETATP